MKNFFVLIWIGRNKSVSIVGTTVKQYFFEVKIDDIFFLLSASRPILIYDRFMKIYVLYNFPKKNA